MLKTPYVGRLGSPFQGSLGPIVVVLTIGATCCQAGASDVDRLAGEVKANVRITLADRHVSGARDAATASKNIEDAAAGKKAQRSHYENAPGGEVTLDARMLRGLLDLAGSHTIRVSEITGGSHSANSRHYAGIAFDVDEIDGRKVSKSHPGVKTIMKKCRELGATEVLGPGDDGHDGHVHAAWPRP